MVHLRRSTRYCNMWNHIRKKISLIPCQLFCAGNCSTTFFCLLFWISPLLVDFANFSCILFHIEVTGTEASAAMFTNFSDLKDLYHHMILLTNTLMLMHTRSLTFHCFFSSWPPRLQVSFDIDAFFLLCSG